MANQLNLQGLIDLFDRAAGALGGTGATILSQEVFGLERRKGSRYSWNELRSQPAEFNKLAASAR